MSAEATKRLWHSSLVRTIKRERSGSARPVQNDGGTHYCASAGSCSYSSHEVHTLFKVQGLRRVGVVSGRPDGVVAGLSALFGIRRGLLLDAAAARPRPLVGRAQAGAPSGAP